jgi:hypothetical protein
VENSDLGATCGDAEGSTLCIVLRNAEPACGSVVFDKTCEALGRADEAVESNLWISSRGSSIGSYWVAQSTLGGISCDVSGPPPMEVPASSDPTPLTWLTV